MTMEAGDSVGFLDYGGAAPPGLLAPDGMLSHTSTPGAQDSGSFCLHVRPFHGVPWALASLPE